MAKKKAKKRARKNHSSPGLVHTFHGAFKRKADAEKKARSVKGFMVGRFTKASGDYRYVVMTKGGGCRSNGATCE